jgi:rod shape-determining protein MreC
MRNLIAFLQRFRIFIYFVFLQVIALSIYFSYIAYPKGQFLTSTWAVSGSFLSWQNDFVKFFHLEENNAALQQENVRLRRNQLSNFVKISSEIIKKHDTIYKQHYDYIPGSVINSTVTRRNNYFTLNIGSNQGVGVGMGVFSDKGIVGVVYMTSTYFSLVKSVLAENSNVDVEIQPSGLNGLLKWDGKDPQRGSVIGISSDVKLAKNSLVYTRGASGIFPKGIPVGRVEKLVPVEGRPIWNVVVKFSQDYRTIQNVYVVKNLLQEEQKNLESKIPIEEKK